MAISSAPVAGTTGNWRAFDITATADGDTTLNIAHGLGRAPTCWYIVPICTDGTELAANAASSWNVQPAGVTATNVQVRKSVLVGSGTANPQARLFVWAGTE